MDKLEQLEQELNKLKEQEENNVEVVEEKQEIASVNDNAVVDLTKVKDTDTLIEEQTKLNLQQIAQNGNFQRLSNEITQKGVATKLDAEDIKVEGERQKNELERYKLKLQKQALREKVKGEVESIKKENAEKRFGYLYETEKYTEIDSETGKEVEKVRYKNFSTNRFINRYKEFTNWYSNLTDSTQAIIWKTIKFLGKLAIVGAVIGLLWWLISWLISQGILKF